MAVAGYTVQTMKAVRLLLLGCALAASFAATAQYQWIDKDGRRVFSDRAPPADVPEKNIIAQPRGSVRAAPASGPAPAAATPAPTPESAAAGAAAPKTDKALEAKKKQAETDEAAKRQAEEAKLAAARAENCKRARNLKATLESGMRMARVNDKGEREVLDDAQRAAELKRANEIIASDCR